MLLNILPSELVDELKEKGTATTQYYELATVMFTDFIGFTNVAERLTPEQLVEELDYCFSNFDRIIERYRVEKIKTVGDAYICASGLSDMNASPSDMVKAALEIQDFLLHVKAERMDQGLPFFEARVGIHTGPVVAGVVLFRPLSLLSPSALGLSSVGVELAPLSGGSISLDWNLLAALPAPVPVPSRRAALVPTPPLPPRATGPPPYPWHSPQTAPRAPPHA